MITKVVAKDLKDLFVKPKSFKNKDSRVELTINPFKIYPIISSPKLFLLTSNNFLFLSYFNIDPITTELTLPKLLSPINNLFKYIFFDIPIAISLNILSPILFPEIHKDSILKLLFDKDSVNNSQVFFPIEL